MYASRTCSVNGFCTSLFNHPRILASTINFAVTGALVLLLTACGGGGGSSPGFGFV